LSDNN